MIPVIAVAAAFAAAVTAAGCRSDPLPVGASAGGPVLTTPLGHYLAGIRADKIGDFPFALESFGHALAADPDDSYLRYRVFLAALSAGRAEEAARLAAMVARGGEPPGLARLTLVVDKIRKGDFDAAESMLAGVADNVVGRLLRTTLLAWARAGRGRTDEALETLSALGGEGPGSAFHDVQAALISEYAGRVADAAGYWRSARDKTERLTLRMVREIGGFHERNGEAGKARELYTTYLRDEPSAIAVRLALRRLDAGRPPPPAVADAAGGAAGALFDVASAVVSGESARIALVYGRLATWLDPELHLAHMLLASVLESMERHEHAIEVYRRVLGDTPFRWTAELEIARNLHDLERDEEAIALFDSLAEREFVRVDALTGLGDLHRHSEDYGKAAEAYGRAIESLDTVEEGHWRLLFKRGMALERAKKWELAERDLERALELNPDQPYVLNYLGYSWVDQGVNLERAREMIERAVAQRPEDGYIRDSLGWVFYRMEDFPTAVRHLERAAELLSRDPTVNDHLGDAYWQVGRRHEARLQWRRALSLDPEPENAEAIRDKLRHGLSPDGEKDS